MAKLLKLVLAFCCLAATGCRDKYGEAMKRLVAEQKQLDWIDSKIKPIKERREKEINEVAERQANAIEGIRANSKTDPSASAEYKAAFDRDSKLSDRQSTE